MHHICLYSNVKHSGVSISSEHVIAFRATMDECESVIATYCTCHYLSFCTNPLLDLVIHCYQNKCSDYAGAGASTSSSIASSRMASSAGANSAPVY
jgi:hypothetical protein